MKKRELYESVREIAGSKNVKLKAVEEMAELIAELSNAQVRLMHGNMIDDDLKAKIIMEIADTIICLEQITGDHNINAEITRKQEQKTGLLAIRALNGDLLKGISK